MGDRVTHRRLRSAPCPTSSVPAVKQAGLMPGRVHAGDGMGVASDAGSGSNASARKVVVKLVVDKGVQAGNK